MKQKEIKELFVRFESAAIEIESLECWSARELQPLLGYAKWDNFVNNVIVKAKQACLTAGEKGENHFRDVTKMVSIGSGVEKQVDDILLTRYACYLIAQNGDSRKPEVAFAQSYFAVQTRRAEVIEQRFQEIERVKAREKLTKTEKQLSGILYERGIDQKGFGMIRSKGDKALFKIDTLTLKRKMGIPEKKPLADFLPTVSIKAKDLAAEMTNVNVQTKDLYGQKPIEEEHIDNNSAVRKMLLNRGIKPEDLPKSEDVNKVKRRLEKDNRNILKNKGQ
ncbi:DNA damage-inducible protein D [Parabacteroides sp. PF5-6]|uniref:DNA damage-inducible protein D n=1 Tax=Parabacteroides sp. PF5-6 TaxID=1742403 RepID=UPI0024053656|nr:DNA damage-inducible protein D [Parabacteroides sp. PF5-6]MDF9830477.1 DNA-damage-inducible protein D [Parabacteroides sp. PF5-6]